VKRIWIHRDKKLRDSDNLLFAKEDSKGTIHGLKFIVNLKTLCKERNIELQHIYTIMDFVEFESSSNLNMKNKNYTIELRLAPTQNSWSFQLQHQ